MTTSVTLSLLVSSSPIRQVEVNLPILDNKVMHYGHKGNNYDFPLNDFISCCERQAQAMTLINEDGKSVLDCHIGGLMAALMAEISESKRLCSRELDMFMDCFSYILKSDGFTTEEIEKMRPNIMQTIRELCSNAIVNE